jgi:choline dehydrogenase
MTIMKLPCLKLIWLTLGLLLTTGAAAAPTAEEAGPDKYDYVVIGSGPGGGVLASNLAKANYSVFLIEAGDDSPGKGFGQYTPTVTWDFWVKHYPEGDKRDNQFNHQTWLTPEGRYWVGPNGAPEGSKLLGIYYPRGATLGGSSMINAMVAWLPSDSDWDYHWNVTGDDSWKSVLSLLPPSSPSKTAPLTVDCLPPSPEPRTCTRSSRASSTTTT